jgi:hypothetical protein
MIPQTGGVLAESILLRRNLLGAIAGERAHVGRPGAVAVA